MALAECYFAVGGDSADDLASSSPSTPGGVGAAVKKTSPINLGSLMRCCVAFGVSELVVVACGKISTFGSHGSAKHLRVVHQSSWADAGQYLRKRGCEVIGISCTPQLDGQVDTVAPFLHARSVGTRPFCKSSAFVTHTARLVYVRKRRPIRLDLIVEMSIVLHHFTCWAKFDERPYTGQKFLVDQHKYRQRGNDLETAKVARDRQRRRDEAQQESLECAQSVAMQFFPLQDEDY